MSVKLPSRFDFGVDLDADITGIPTAYSFAITGLPKIAIGLDPIEIKPLEIKPIEIKPLDLSFRIKEIPSVRVHLPTDYRVGLIPNPTLPLATAVGASSAFPPVMSPVVIDLDPALWQNQEGADLFPQVEFRKRLYLSDGGVYDNMGLEAIWQRCKTVLVSDAGAPFSPEATPERSWLNQVTRVLDIAC